MYYPVIFMKTENKHRYSLSNKIHIDRFCGATISKRFSFNREEFCMHIGNNIVSYIANNDNKVVAVLSNGDALPININDYNFCGTCKRKLIKLLKNK